MSHFIVQTAAASMPQSCWGTYRRVAVLEVEDGVQKVAMISRRARGVVRIVHLADKLSVGKTARCAYEKALAWAKEYAAELNGGQHG
jgi:hypothetical protein